MKVAKFAVFLFFSGFLFSNVFASNGSRNLAKEIDEMLRKEEKEDLKRPGQMSSFDVGLIKRRIQHYRSEYEAITKDSEEVIKDAKEYEKSEEWAKNRVKGPKIPKFVVLDNIELDFLGQDIFFGTATDLDSMSKLELEKHADEMQNNLKSIRLKVLMEKQKMNFLKEEAGLQHKW